MFVVGRSSPGKVSVGIPDPFQQQCLAEWDAGEEGLIEAQHVADSMNQAYEKGQASIRDAMRRLIGVTR